MWSRPSDAIRADRSQQCDLGIFFVRALFGPAGTWRPPWLTRVRRIWRSFVPFPAYQVFQRGGYYSVEVIPNSVAVISLNTMYFYDSNTGTLPHTRYLLNCILTSRHGDGAAVGGCGHSDPQDPGNLEFDWLEVQLQMFRERKMQVRPARPWPRKCSLIECVRRFGYRATSRRRRATTSRNVLVGSGLSPSREDVMRC